MRDIEAIAKKYNIVFDEDEWPDIRDGVQKGVSYDALMPLLLMRTEWLKNKVDRLRSLV